MCFQFNRQLQADPNHLLQCGPGWPRYPEQASGSEGGDASQDQGSLRLQELEKGACHHGEAKPPYHRLLGRCRLCRLLLRLVLDLCPLEATLATRLEARGSSASGCTRSRCFYNCHHQFYDDDVIVATKGCFSAENPMFAGLKRQNPMPAMMMLTMMNTNGNDWWWRRQGPCLYLGLAVWYSLVFTCICHLVSNVFPISSHHENADHGDQNYHDNDDADSDDDDKIRSTSGIFFFYLSNYHADQIQI